jgi:hypothetical protein
MLHMSRLAALCGISILPVLVLGPTTSASADVTDPIATYKSTHDVDPHLPLSGSDLALLAVKERAASAHLTPVSGQDVVPLAALALAANQQPQQTSYWCGPATLVESLGQKGATMTQSSAAGYLKTTTSGTAWSGVNASVPNPTGYPMRDVMNWKLGTSFYVPKALPYSPTSADKATYNTNLHSDIDQRYPVMGDAWEVANGPHLVGHPLAYTIFHWFNIRGYDYVPGYNLTMYEDSVHGASTISWSSSVPAYSTFDSNTLVTIMGGRGYVW